MPGAMVEIWHCNASGKYIHPNDSNDAPEDPNFYGAARLLADEAGRVELRSVKPGAYPVPDTDGWWRPPHIHFSVWGRVWLSRLVTQMFFPGDPLNERDPILNAVREANKIGRVKIITFDEADETLRGVSEGAIHATVVQQPFEFGYLAITRMAQAARGDRSFIPESKQIIVPTLVVNRSMM